MARSGMLIDSFDLTAIGLFVEQGVSGTRSGASIRYPVAFMGGRLDGLFLSQGGVTDPRRVTVPLFGRGLDLTELLEHLEALKRRCYGRDVRVAFTDSPYYRVGRLEGCEVVPYPPELIQPAHRVLLTFLFADPRSFAVSETNVALSGTPAACPVESAEVRPVITVTGGSSVAIIHRDGGGTIVRQMTFVGAASTLVVDCAEGLIHDGAGNSLAAMLNTGTFIVLSPRHAVPGGAAQTLEVTSGSGLAVYRQARA